MAKQVMSVAIDARQSVTQGAADAFAQATIQTSLSAAAKVGWLLKRLEWEVGAVTQLLTVGVDLEFQLCLAQDSMATMPNILDSSVLWKRAVVYPLTTSGLTEVAATGTHEFPEGTIIVAPQLYWMMDSTGAGAALTAYVKLVYEMVELTEVDFLRLLAAV